MISKSFHAGADCYDSGAMRDLAILFVLKRSMNRDSSFLTAVLNGVFTVPGDRCVDYKTVLSIMKTLATRDGCIGNISTLLSLFHQVNKEIHDAVQPWSSRRLQLQVLITDLFPCAKPGRSCNQQYQPVHSLTGEFLKHLSSSVYSILRRIPMHSPTSWVLVQRN